MQEIDQIKGLNFNVFNRHLLFHRFCLNLALRICDAEIKSSCPSARSCQKSLTYDIRCLYFLKITATAIVFEHIPLFVMCDAVRHSFNLSHGFFLGKLDCLTDKLCFGSYSCCLIQINCICESEVLNWHILLLLMMKLEHRLLCIGELLLHHHVIHLVG